MSKIKLSEELKKAITMMPVKEKDKLLLRLITKDYHLVQQLEFKLLEDGATAEDRRGEIREEIHQTLIESHRYFYSPGYLLLDLRNLSGKINQHVKTTKDKYGEIELNFFMLNTALQLMGDKIRNFSMIKSRTLNEYVIRRAAKLLKLIEKLHEDFRLDFHPAMIELAEHISSTPTLMKTAINHMFDPNWLLQNEWPEL